MVAWSKNQESGLQTETFMLLLHKLGFHLATDVGKCFPRIPHFWSADHLLNLALKVGPLRKEELKMDLSLLATDRDNAGADQIDHATTSVSFMDEDIIPTFQKSPTSSQEDVSLFAM